MTGGADFALLAVAALAAGLVRGYSGFGPALVFVPVAARVLPPADAVICLVIMDLAGAVQLLPDGLRHGNRKAAAQLALGGLFGVPLGVWLLTLADPQVFRWVACLLALLLLALIAAGVRLRGDPGPATRGSVGFLAGCMNGFAAMGGPPVILFELGGGGGRNAREIRANIILFLTAVIILTLLNYGLRGLISREIVLTGAVLTIPYVLAIAAGRRLFGVGSEVLFRRLAYAVVGCAALAGLPVFG